MNDRMTYKRKITTVALVVIIFSFIYIPILMHSLVYDVSRVTKHTAVDVVLLSKLDILGTEFDGASIEIRNSDQTVAAGILDGEEVQQLKWVSQDGTNQLIGLAPGEYIFHEEATVDGYSQVTDVRFQVNTDGTVDKKTALSSMSDSDDGRITK